MSNNNPQHQPYSEENLQLVELTETTALAQSFEQFAERLLPGVIGMTNSYSALLYIPDSHLLTPHFFVQGLPKPIKPTPITAACFILSSIAEEIAFAIRNANVFEYVVNSYCKQRQGQNSCKGCQRPLGSWTPCVKYRDVEV